MDAYRTLLLTMPLRATIPWLFLMNFGIFALCVGIGELIVRALPHRKVCEPPKLRAHECVMAVITVIMNTLVSIAGLWLHRKGWIQFRTDVGLRALLDVPVLLMAMDLSMYVFHRVAHVQLLFPLIHRTHHRYDSPRPLDFFVLSPQENLGFGALWLVVLMIYPSSWLGMSIYLTLNTVYGAVGHLGVEPFPDGWVRMPVARWIATSTFHTLHHRDPSHNFGFYTLFWDRLFGTLSPRYVPDFGRMQLSSGEVDVRP